MCVAMPAHCMSPASQNKIQLHHCPSEYTTVVHTVHNIVIAWPMAGSCSRYEFVILLFRPVLLFHQSQHFGPMQNGDVKHCSHCVCVHIKLYGTAAVR